MLSLKRCKEILQQDGTSYTDDEVRHLRTLLYQLGYIDYETFTGRQSEQARGPLHASVNGRASREGV